MERPTDRPGEDEEGQKGDEAESALSRPFHVR